MKWTKDKLDLFFAMKDEGCTLTEIAEALGCSKQCVYDKQSALKKQLPGYMPAKKAKRGRASATVSKMENIADEITTEVHREVTPGTREYESVGENPCLTHKPRLLQVVENMIDYVAKLGFKEPTHFYCDINEMREEAHVSVLDGTGKVYELNLSVTDPQKVAL